jgi:hypothetical protein
MACTGRAWAVENTSHTVSPSSPASGSMLANYDPDRLMRYSDPTSGAFTSKASDVHLNLVSMQLHQLSA